jgi:hypothetical protein
MVAQRRMTQQSVRVHTERALPADSEPQFAPKGEAVTILRPSGTLLAIERTRAGASSPIPSRRVREQALVERGRRGSTPGG